MSGADSKKRLTAGVPAERCFFFGGGVVCVKGFLCAEFSETLFRHGCQKLQFLKLCAWTCSQTMHSTCTRCVDFLPPRALHKTLTSGANVALYGATTPFFPCSNFGPCRVFEGPWMADNFAIIFPFRSVVGFVWSGFVFRIVVRVGWSVIFFELSFVLGGPFFSYCRPFRTVRFFT